MFGLQKCFGVGLIVYLYLYSIGNIMFALSFKLRLACKFLQIVATGFFALKIGTGFKNRVFKISVQSLLQSISKKPFKQ